MTTNKPEIACWGSFYKGVMQDFGYSEEATKSAAKLDFHGYELSIDPLVRLSDYERLQAEAERLQADHVAERAADKARIDELLGLLRDIQADLLRRGEKDSDGCTVVNLGNGLWCRIDAALSHPKVDA